MSRSLGVASCATATREQIVSFAHHVPGPRPVQVPNDPPHLFPPFVEPPTRQDRLHQRWSKRGRRFGRYHSNNALTTRRRRRSAATATQLGAWNPSSRKPKKSGIRCCSGVEGSTTRSSWAPFIRARSRRPI